jgi:hypothetical protein
MSLRTCVITPRVASVVDSLNRVRLECVLKRVGHTYAANTFR